MKEKISPLGKGKSPVNFYLNNRKTAFGFFLLNWGLLNLELLCFIEASGEHLDTGMKSLLLTRGVINKYSATQSFYMLDLIFSMRFNRKGTW